MKNLPGLVGLLLFGILSGMLISAIGDPINQASTNEVFEAKTSLTCIGIMFSLMFLSYAAGRIDERDA